MYLLVLYLFSSVCLYYLMCWDKAKASKGKWRIPERTLFMWAVFGGAFGGVLGMRRFRHKTNERIFKYGFPALLVLQIIILVVVLFLWDVPVPAEWQAALG